MIENIKRIKLSDDYCLVTRNDSGHTHIGSVQVKANEAAQFLDDLRTVFAEMGLLTNTGKEKA